MDKHILDAIECLTAQVNSELGTKDITEKEIVMYFSDEELPAFLSGWLMAKGVSISNTADLSKEYVLKLLEE